MAIQTDVATFDHHSSAAAANKTTSLELQILENDVDTLISSALEVSTTLHNLHDQAIIHDNREEHSILVLLIRADGVEAVFVTAVGLHVGREDYGTVVVVRQDGRRQGDARKVAPVICVADPASRTCVCFALMHASRKCKSCYQTANA